jgi:polyhydroxyalkanoate synthase subunit PhaC
VLSASGHIAGVVNPPRSKYGHWENDKNPPTSEEWLATATAVRDSWWPVWERWVTQYAGGEVPARHPGDGKLKPLEDAPGSLRQGARRGLTAATPPPEEAHSGEGCAEHR